MILKLTQFGEPVLRERARALTPDEIRGAPVQQLIAFMRDTLRDAPGVGLAAPQVGEGVQLAIVEDRAEYQRGWSAAELKARERVPVPFHVLVNPRLVVEQPEGEAEFFEGCLSATGLVGMVRRARVVRVEALNERAEPVTITARGWYARILQHEVDHLGGTLYLDRAAPRSVMSATNFERHWRASSPAEVRAKLELDRAP